MEKKKPKTISRVAATSDVRNCSSSLEKAVVVASMEGITQQAAADYFDVSTDATRRGRKAKASCRQIGKVGRPPRLLPEDEQALVYELDAKMLAHQEVTVEDVKEAVFSAFFFLLSP